MLFSIIMFKILVLKIAHNMLKHHVMVKLPCMLYMYIDILYVLSHKVPHCCESHGRVQLVLHLGGDGLTRVARGLSIYLISPLIRLRLQRGGGGGGGELCTYKYCLPVQ